MPQNRISIGAQNLDSSLFSSLLCKDEVWGWENNPVSVSAADSSWAVMKISVPDGAVDALSNRGRRSNDEYKALANFIDFNSQQNFCNFWYLRHHQGQQQMAHWLLSAWHFHVSIDRWAKISFASSSLLLCKRNENMLPGSNKATLNKDFTTKAVIILFKTTAALLVEVDLPTYFSSVFTEAGCDIAPKQTMGMNNPAWHLRFTHQPPLGSPHPRAEHAWGTQRPRRARAPLPGAQPCLGRLQAGGLRGRHSGGEAGTARHGRGLGLLGAGGPGCAPPSASGTRRRRRRRRTRTVLVSSCHLQSSLWGLGRAALCTEMSLC